MIATREPERSAPTAPPSVASGTSPAVAVRTERGDGPGGDVVVARVVDRDEEAQGGVVLDHGLGHLVDHAVPVTDALLGVVLTLVELAAADSAGAAGVGAVPLQEVDVLRVIAAEPTSALQPDPAFPLLLGEVQVHRGIEGHAELMQRPVQGLRLVGDEAVAATWGKLAAAALKAGLPRPVNDMWNAACCLAYDLPLATLNLKDCDYFRTDHGLRVLGAE
jgi:hypothetical protein